MSNFFGRIRIIPRQSSFLDRISGSSGQIYTNKDSGSIRVYNGDDPGGKELATSDFKNIESTAELDLLSKKNRIRFHWDTLNDLETEVDPVVYHGMIAHVHSEGRLYFAHASAWTPVANLSEISDTDIPYEPDSADELQWVEGTYDFGNNIIKYANAIQLEADLANYSPVTYHGMTMHVHETGALYYAHAGAWRKLLTDVTYNDAESAGYINPLSTVAYSNDYDDLDNSPQSILDLGISDGANGQVLSTDGAGTFSFVNPSSVGTGSSFDLIESDDGSFNADDVSNLRILGGENISTEVVTDSNELTINLEPFSINFLTDVDTESNPPATGEVLKWDGAKWAPGIDVAEGGSGLDADTLDGQDGSYYLDYNNFTNTPSVLTLSDISVGNEQTASGNGAISYDNATGVFRFTPPTAEGIGALSSVAFSDLTATPTTISGYGITDAFSGDYEDLTSKPAIPEVLTDLGITDGSDGEVLTTDGAGNFQFEAVTGGSGDPDQNLFATINADTGSATADTTTDTFTIAGGTNIETAITGDTVTVSFTGTTGAGAATFDELADISSAGIDVDDIFESAVVTLRVNNNGATSYLFDSHYSGDNPTIYATSGTTIAFDLDQIGGHPFEIQNSSGTAITGGLVHVSATGTVTTGSSAQGFDSGTLYWRIEESISGNYQYQCQIHAGMNGTITINRLSQSLSETDTLDSVTGRGNSTSNAITVGGLTSQGVSTFQQTTEVLNTKTGATGPVTHDFSTGAIWYHSSISADFTANFTNIPTTADRAISVVLVLDQGATGYLSNAVEIDGAAQTINWSNGVAPSATDNAIDIVSFTLIRTGASWTVLGSLTSHS